MDFDLNEEFWDLWNGYKAEVANRDSADYELNSRQFQKYLEVCRVLTKAAEDHGGRIDPLRIAPAEEHCGITVYAPLYYFTGEEIAKLSKALLNVSGISIDCTIDGDVCISAIIPNVFQKREEE